MTRRTSGALWKATLPDCAAALAWSPDGRQLAAATLAGPVVVFDAAGGRAVVEHAGHAGGALTVAWSPDGARLATGGQDGRVVLHDAGVATIIDGDDSWVEHLAWSAMGDLLSIAAGRRVRVLTASGAIATEVTGYGSTVTSLFWLPGKSELVTSCYGGLQFTKVGRADWTRQLDWKGSILTARPSPDGKHIATGNQDGTVHVWETRSGKDLQMSGYPLKVRELAWSADSALLATGGGAVVTVWSFAGKGPAGQKPAQLAGHEERVTGVVFAGRGLVSTSEDGTMRMWSRRNGWQCVRTENAGRPLTSLAVSPDGRLVAAASDAGTVLVWSQESANE